MDLAPNSTKSMECLKRYSAKSCFVLTRVVGWKLPTFATHYTSYWFICFSFLRHRRPFLLATFPVARCSPPDSPERWPRPRPRRRRLPAWRSPTRRTRPRPRRRRLPGWISSPPCGGPRPRPRPAPPPGVELPHAGSIHRFHDDEKVALGGQLGGCWRRGLLHGRDSKAKTQGRWSRVEEPTAIHRPEQLPFPLGTQTRDSPRVVQVDGGDELGGELLLGWKRSRAIAARACPGRWPSWRGCWSVPLSAATPRARVQVRPPTDQLVSLH
jgi:hypothetical protein